MGKTTLRLTKALKREYAYIFDENFQYPGIPKVKRHELKNTPLSIKGINITPIKVMHYKLPVFGSSRVPISTKIGQNNLWPSL